MRRPVAIVLIVSAALSACIGHRGGRDEVGRPPPASLPSRARFELAVDARDASRSLSLGSAGYLDRAAKRAAFHVDLTAIDASIGAIDVIEIDGTVYVSCARLAAAFGVATRWLSARRPVDALTAFSLVDPLTWSETDGVTVAREVAADGLVRAVTMRFDASPEGGSAVVTMRYFDVGIPVRIDAPPPADVTDVTHALGG